MDVKFTLEIRLHPFTAAAPHMKSCSCIDQEISIYPCLPHPRLKVIQQTHVYLLLSLMLNIYLEVTFRRKMRTRPLSDQFP